MRFSYFLNVFPFSFSMTNSYLLFSLGFIQTFNLHFGQVS